MRAAKTRITPRVKLEMDWDPVGEIRIGERTRDLGNFPWYDSVRDWFNHHLCCELGLRKVERGMRVTETVTEPLS